MSYFIRDYGKYLLILFLFIIIGFILFYFTYKNVKQETIESLNARQMIHAKQASKGIENFFDDHAQILLAIARNEHIIALDKIGKGLIRDIQLSKKGEINIVSRIDSQGRILYAEPYNSSVIGQTIINSSMDSFQKVRQTHQVSVSGVFTNKRGFKSIIIHAPVLTKDGVFTGTLAMLLSFEAIAKKYLEDIRVGKNGYAWVISSKGIEIYCPVPGHVGNSVFDNCREFPDIIEMAKKMVRGEQGVTKYTFDRIGDSASSKTVKHAVFMPIRVGDSFWSIVVATPEDQIIRTLSVFRDRLLLIAALLITMIGIFLYMLINTMVVVKKIEQIKLIEKDLRESQQRLNASQRIARIGDITWDVATGDVVLSDGIYELTQYDKPEKIDIRWVYEKTCYPDDLDGVAGWLNDCIASSRDILPPHEYRIIRKDGTILLVQGIGTIQRNGDNVRVFMSIQDITQRKQAEEELRRTNAFLDSIVENIPDMVFLKSAEDLRFVSFNRAGEDLLGISRNELIGKKDHDFFNKEQADFYIQKDREVLHGKQVVDIPQESIQTRNKGERILHTKKVPILDKNGEPEYLLGISEDITERKQTDEELFNEKEKLLILSENAPLGMVLIKNDGQFIYINPKFKDIFGYDSSEIPDGITWFKKAYPDAAYRHEVVSAWLYDLENAGHGEGQQRVFNVKCKNGLIKTINFIPVILKNGDNIMVCEDITERKRMETQLMNAQKMEAVGTLSGGIAHDFNNILMGIQGNTSLMLLDISADHPHYERLKYIEDQVKSAADLTSQLLGFARGGKYVVKPLNMNELIKKTSTMFGRTKKELAIHRKYEKNIWIVEADQTQIEQVLLNLYLNAWQAMPAGGDLSLETNNIFVNEDSIKPYPIMPEGKYVRISVSDSGVGMSDKTKEKIFEPFFTTKELGRGTGLGLAMVYGIIKNHNGFIDVISELGRGTTFDFYLPASEKDVLKAKSAPPEIIRGTETILLVDDEPDVLAVSKELLGSLGYSIFAVKNGEEAITLYKQKKDEIDLVILDMIMPGLSGSEIFDGIRELNPSARIILSSGYSLNDQAQKIMDKGCQGFIQKPFSIIQLSRKIREVLAVSHSSHVSDLTGT